MKKKILIHIFLGIPILLLIFFSNRLIGKALGGFQKVNLQDYSGSNTVYYCVDRFESLGTLEEKINIEGWAFLESDKTENKQIVMLLQSDRDCYAARANLRERTDVYDVFYGTVPLTGIDAGFWLDLPTVGVRSGKYELLIYVRENDETEGIIKTGWHLVKDGSDQKIVPPGEEY